MTKKKKSKKCFCGRKIEDDYFECERCRDLALIRFFVPI